MIKKIINILALILVCLISFQEYGKYKQKKGARLRERDKVGI